jgi:hypothetical protein
VALERVADAQHPIGELLPTATASTTTLAADFATIRLHGLRLSWWTEGNRIHDDGAAGLARRRVWRRV